MKRIIDDEFLRTFSKLYNTFFEFGLYPKEILSILTSLYRVSESQYYNYLKRSRDKGFVTTSYKDLQNRFLSRVKSNSGKVEITDIQSLIDKALSK